MARWRKDSVAAWTDEADQRLAAMYDEDGLGPIEIADRMGRSVSAVRNRLTNLRKAGKVGPARGRGGRRSQMALCEP